MKIFSWNKTISNTIKDYKIILFSKPCFEIEKFELRLNFTSLYFKNIYNVHNIVYHQTNVSRKNLLLQIMPILSKNIWSTPAM